MLGIEDRQPRPRINAEPRPFDLGPEDRAGSGEVFVKLWRRNDGESRGLSWVREDGEFGWEIWRNGVGFRKGDPQGGRE